ncbi:hypothetical protein [Intrasporangium sp.]|uniref:WXG100 family type VII secretion target n=1 Tax=Intrasporangium sp. TaxID=1925024 RepID=UPI00293AF465|nr:hypothetical protein [Intrasporangium sp.]MDV3222795.1 hypothetical protein [Intrasporangium sp.]
MRFGVDPAALGRDSGRYGEAVRTLDGVDVAAALAPLAAAFPGGLTAAAIRTLGEAWHDRLVRVRLALEEVGSGLATAGSSYAAVEQGARRALGTGDTP